MKPALMAGLPVHSPILLHWQTLTIPIAPSQPVVARVAKLLLAAVVGLWCMLRITDLRMADLRMAVLRMADKFASARTHQVRPLLRRFYYGFAGLAHVVRCEWSMRFHLAAAAGAVAACACFRVSAMEWMLVLIAVALVLSAECLNTSVERLADRVCKEDDSLIRQCKDAAAAGVLVMAILSVMIGAIIFLPRLLKLLAL